MPKGLTHYKVHFPTGATGTDDGEVLPSWAEDIADCIAWFALCQPETAIEPAFGNGIFVSEIRRMAVFNMVQMANGEDRKVCLVLSRKGDFSGFLFGKWHFTGR